MTTDAPASSTTTASRVTQAPASLRLSAALQLLQAVAMLIATGFSASATADGKSYQAGSGIALTLIAFGSALCIAGFAYATARAKPWSRTPVLLIQVLMVIGGIMLVQGHRLDWGIPVLILAAATTGSLLAPASLKALNREM
jgi:threonine/homoserine/homoserine lactone efflux protein